jgi:hypothetical protein
MRISLRANRYNFNGNKQCTRHDQRGDALKDHVSYAFVCSAPLRGRFLILAEDRPDEL